MKNLIAILLLLPTLALATDQEKPGNGYGRDKWGDKVYNNPSLNVSTGQFTNTKASAAASASSKSSSFAGSSSQAGSSNGSMTINQGSVDYPNQAPAIVTTSAPSFSQRNCTPVGSVNASGPFGGLGIAFPMGGDVCNGLNEADKIGDWERESGDAKLWLVQCNLMITKDSDLADAFEASGYSCKDAYIKRQADVNARAKMQALGQR